VIADYISGEEVSVNDYLQNRLLIAMPGMEDERFAKAVCYLCDHDERGALGLVINQPIGLHLSDLLEQMSIVNDNPSTQSITVFSGGPVHKDRGFVVSRKVRRTPIWRSYTQVGDYCVTTSRDILEAIAQRKGPKEFLVALGYAAWGPGQLEDELRNNYWLVTQASPELLYKVPVAERWEYAIASLGITPGQLVGVAGNA
jgi:putative transcriptional regulator